MSTAESDSKKQVNEIEDIENAVTMRSEQGTFAPDIKITNPVKARNSSREFPLKNDQRYQFIEFVGEGGMGRVFKVMDQRLNRVVALKFIRGNDSEMLERFFQEAQAQARIKHEHICKVYEVSEIDGVPFISMQFIDGISLKEASNQLTIDEKVRIIKISSEAIHAAHRLGLIHRDIKPSNIMLERDGDGIWQPYIMDFGLVREVQAEGMTMTGQIMGTPAYMAPEQALGEIRELDRRTDVYSLGATLYNLLTGHSPFPEASGFEIMIKIVKDEPMPLRRANAKLPADLETIVMKCLEKEQARRYDSAKSLADDLQRYLDGEPIQARPASLVYIIGKKAVKHRYIVAVSLVSFLLLMSVSGFWLRSRWRAAEQLRMAQQFGQQAEKLQNIMQVAYLLPLHDTAADRAIVEARMQKIEADMKELGSASLGPGHYALGSGYLALHDYERAYQHLQRCREIGYQNAEVDYALGLTMGELYLKRLEAAEQIGVKELREARIKSIEQQYRDPALKLLRSLNSNEVASPAYVEGLIAFYEKRYDEALTKAQLAFQQQPSLYNARRLEATTYLSIGIQKDVKGDYDGALADYQRAGAGYGAAIEIGRSDPTLYSGESARWTLVMEANALMGKPSEEAFDHAIAAADRAISADSQDVDALHKKGWACYRWGENLKRAGEDPRKILWKAIEEETRALRIVPQDINSYNSIGSCYWVLGEYEIERGLSPYRSLELAIENFNEAIKVEPRSPGPYNNLGNVYRTRGFYEKDHGKDPQASIGLAIENYRKTIELDPNRAWPYNNLGNTYNTFAEYQLGNNADPRAALDQAIENYRRAIAVNAKLPSPYNNIGDAARKKALYLVRQQQDPTAVLEEGRNALKQAVELNPTNSIYRLAQGEIELMAARWQMARNLSPDNFFSKSRAAIDKSIELNDQDADNFRALAELLRWQSEWLIKAHQQPQELIKTGEVAVDKALAINPELTEALALRGAFYLLESQLSNGATQAQLQTKSRAILTDAISKNPLLKPEYQPLIDGIK